MNGAHGQILTHHAKGNSELCLPDGVGMDQMAKMFIKNANDNPEILHHPAEVQLYFTLLKAFPCPGE
jgi:hypothetical protein